MRAIGYYRCSTQAQADDGVNLALEPEAIRRHCAGQGIELVDVVTDPNVSGGKPFAKRRGGTEVLCRVRAGEAQLIVTTYLDRLFRDTHDGLTCMRQTFPKVGARVLCICDALDLSTPAGRLNATMRLATAEFERDMIVDRATRVSTNLRESGKQYGHVPFGCVSAPDGALQRDPIAWAIREQIVQWSRSGLGLRVIASMLRERGIAAPRGGRQWHTSTLSELIASHGGLAHLAVREVSAPSAVGA